MTISYEWRRSVEKALWKRSRGQWLECESEPLVLKSKDCVLCQITFSVETHPRRITNSIARKDLNNTKNY